MGGEETTVRRKVTFRLGAEVAPAGKKVPLRVRTAS
jgi:hypothetical protein